MIFLSSLEVVSALPFVVEAVLADSYNNLNIDVLILFILDFLYLKSPLQK